MPLLIIRNSRNNYVIFYIQLVSIQFFPIRKPIFHYKRIIGFVYVIFFAATVGGISIIVIQLTKQDDFRLINSIIVYFKHIILWKIQIHPFSDTYRNGFFL